MESTSAVLILIVVVLAVFLFFKLLAKPIKFAFKVLLNAAIGFVLLFLVNFFGSYIGLSIEMNAVNAVIVGFLGVPGIVLILVFHMFF